MPKLLTVALMILLAVLAVSVGQAADTSRAALAVLVTVFAVALSIPASLAVGLVLERRRPRVVYYNDNRRIIIVRPAEPPARVSEPERSVTIR